jgi:hypothetical protein
MKVTRRRFMVYAGLASASVLTASRAATVLGAGKVPWYANVNRWGQINMSEQDVALYDVGFWRSQWKRTAVQAILTNAVAGFATFPSKNPLVFSSPFAPDRDLMAEINSAARADGLYVVARMDSGVINPKIAEAYDDWRSRKADGTPGTGMCPNSPYLEQHVFSVYREVIDRYHVVGFADNGGIGNGQICYCHRCVARYRQDTGKELPRVAKLDNREFREWTRWNTDVIMENWEKTNRALKQMGGQDCVYLGMVRKFSRYNREVATRAELLLMDCQSRNDSASFHEHADEGRFMHSILGWNKNIAVATSMTQHSHGYFRWTTDPAAEATLHMKAGIAGGFNPWWHHPTAYSADRRSLDIAPEIYDWHRKNDRFLTNRTPVATAGIVRSDDSSTFFGRDAPPFYQPGLISGITQVPYRGMVHALFQTRIPYYPLHIADVERHGADLQMLVLPNLGGMSDAECSAIRAFVKEGGSLLATGMTSLYDADGEPRMDFGLADVFGAHLQQPAPSPRFFEDANSQSYLRLLMGAGGERHAILDGLEDIDALAYGGAAIPLTIDSDREVLASFVMMPGSAADIWPEAKVADQPALVLGRYGKGRAAFLPVDLDCRLLDDADPDNARLLGNVLRWCAGSAPSVIVEGPGYVGSYLYRQGPRRILHLFNGSGVDNGEEITDRTFAVGPLRVSVRMTGGRGIVRALVNNRIIPSQVKDGLVVFEIKRLDDHEVLVIV